MVIILMGVCGSGKTSVGLCLAERLNCDFFDGDDFHPPANVDKMRAGEALTDEDRWPWLQTLSDKIAEWAQRPQGAVLACSALTAIYRAKLGANTPADNPNITLVYLKGSPELLAQRIASRENHYMPASLLDSQLAKLQEPTDGQDALVIDITPPPTQIADQIINRLPK